jgi:hypothetical protein
MDVSEARATDEGETMFVLMVDRNGKNATPMTVEESTKAVRDGWQALYTSVWGDSETDNDNK